MIASYRLAQLMQIKKYSSLAGQIKKRPHLRGLSVWRIMRAADVTRSLYYQIRLAPEPHSSRSTALRYNFVIRAYGKLA
jgi:hypothetical protein